MPVRFLADAKSEFADQEAWYEKRQEGLGAEFYAAIKATIAEVAAHPTDFRSTAQAYVGVWRSVFLSP